jgi:hypothetical protein
MGKKASKLDENLIKNPVLPQKPTIFMGFQRLLPQIESLIIF